MKFLNKTLLATTLAMTLVTGAVAATTVQTLDITWYKDGQVIDNGRHIVAGDAGPATYMHRSGQEVGYAHCTTVAGSTKLSAESLFVGRSLIVKPVSVQPDRVRLSVSAVDTVLDGKHKTGTADCTSEVVDAHGYTASGIPVDIADGQTIEVPLQNPQYRLVLKLHRDAL